MMYGMKKTTLYLPDALKAALAARARAEGCSEAELIRGAIADRVRGGSGVRPTLPLTGRPLGDPTAAERVDELLRGFGDS